MKIDENTTPLLTVDHLKQYFKVSGSFTVKAVEDVSFKIYPDGNAVVPNKFLTDNEGLREAVGLLLHSVGKLESKLLSGSHERLKFWRPVYPYMPRGW